MVAIGGGRNDTLAIFQLELAFNLRFPSLTPLTHIVKHLETGLFCPYGPIKQELALDRHRNFTASRIVIGCARRKIMKSDVRNHLHAIEAMDFPKQLGLPFRSYYFIGVQCRACGDLYRHDRSLFLH